MKDNLQNLRHSCAHLLAAAVMEIWPKAKRTIGPAIENGFYFDFDFGDIKISKDDFPKIEKKMMELAKTWKSFVRSEMSPADAKKEYPDNEYKHELIDEISKKDKIISFYKSGNYSDLCEGGHCDKPSEQLKHFKLLSLAGAYWRGDEKNKMLTRIYGTAFASKEDLDKYLWQVEEAKKRDHRKLGKDLDLFIIPQEVGPGLIIWTPKGAIIRQEVEKLIISEQIKRGYEHVYSPHIGRKSLWETSGHWDLYREKMYAPMIIDNEEYLVKPMNCPMHMMVYKSKPRSYRDLPIKIAENATVYRYEQTGELSGMLRVRYITQDDSHIFCRESQAIDEFIGVFDYMSFLLKTFGLTNYYLRLGLRSPKEKYLGNDEVWAKAEKEITKAIEKKGLNYVKSVGDAAFYGPKLDVIIKDVLGREWQCGTIQIDFMLPERFNLEYVDENGKIKKPVLIHRAPLGSLERWVAILIEHYAGAFPLWLSPVQIAVLPISDKVLNFAKKIQQIFLDNGLRSELNEDNKTLGAKIRESTLQKIPYIVIIGEREVESHKVHKVYKVSARTREGKDLGQVDIYQFIENLKKQVETFQ